jgi:FixJ family two-component response regulator
MSDMTESTKTVFVVDDDASFLIGIRRLLHASGYAPECYSSANDFLAQLSPTASGCVIVDLSMPGMDGMALQEAIAQSENPLPVVFLTGQGDIPSSVAAMRRGAVDFLVKTAPKETLIAAIDRALARNSREREARTHLHELQSRFDQLTPREREVLSHVLKGQLNKKIAVTLGIDERSVKRHRTNLMRKLGVSSVAELVHISIESGVSSKHGE